jgi:hypothetical protein
MSCMTPGPASIAIDLSDAAWAAARVNAHGIAYMQIPVGPDGSTLALGQAVVAVDVENAIAAEASVMKVDLRDGHVLLAVDRNCIRENLPDDPDCE